MKFNIKIDEENMAKQKTVENNMTDADLATLREIQQIRSEGKALANEIKTQTYIQPMVRPENQTYDDNVKKMGHTQEKHCDIL